jgi:hypothetical protein
VRSVRFHFHEIGPEFSNEDALLRRLRAYFLGFLSKLRAHTKSSNHCDGSALTPSPSPWGEGSRIQSPSPRGEGFRVRAVRQDLYLISFLSKPKDFRMVTKPLFDPIEQPLRTFPRN